MIKNISAQASKAFKSARISTNIHKSASAKVSRSVTIPSQASDVRNIYCDGNSTTSDKVISSLNLDDFCKLGYNSVPYYIMILQINLSVDDHQVLLVVYPSV